MQDNDAPHMNEDHGSKKHINVLVSMLNEKNKYIKVLHTKIDTLNDKMQHVQINKSSTK